MKKFSRYTLLAIASFIFISAMLLVRPTQANAAVTGFSDEVFCQWENSGDILCTQIGDGLQGFLDDIGDIVDNISLTPNEIPVFGSDAQRSDYQRFISAVADKAGDACRTAGNQCHNYHYNPAASEANGYPVFCNTTDFGGGNDAIRGVNCLHAVFANPVFMYGTGNTNAVTRASASGDTQDIFAVSWESPSDPTADPPDNHCGVTRTTNCVYEESGDEFTGAGFAAGPYLTRLEEAIAAAEGSGDECETTISNPLSFILCPVRDALVDAFGNVIDYLTRLLENPNLSSNDNLPNAIRGMITLANSFYILIFLFIIFANFVAIPGLDNYTIKKTLPKLIAAIILTQFSLLICQVVLDLGNILAVTLPSQLLSAFGISGTPGQAFADVVIPSAEGNFFQNLGQFIIMILVLLVGLIVGLIAFFYLIARYLFIILLVLTLPLAFAAWVLPNTEQYFKKWWEYFIRLSLMFLLISILFAGGAIFSNLLTSGDLFGTGASGFLTQLIALCVPLVVLLLVPKTLKVSGAIMSKSKEAAAKGFGNAKDSYAGKKISKSAQEGKLAEAKGGAYEKFGQAGVLGAKRSARLEAKGAGLKAKGTENLKKDVAELPLERQIHLANNSKNKDVANAARSAVLKRQDELLNKRVLDGKGVADLKEIGKHAKIGSGADAKDNPIYGDSRLDQVVAGQTNPFWNNGGGSSGSGGGSTSTPLGPTTPLPPPSSTGSSSSSSGGWSSWGSSSSGTSSSSSSSSSGSSRGTTAPTPPPSPSSPSARWRSATPRPSSTGGPSVIPGSGGAVDLSGLGGDAKTGPDGRSTVPPPPDSTPTPPEPPPTTE